MNIDAIQRGMGVVAGDAHGDRLLDDPDPGAPDTSVSDVSLPNNNRRKFMPSAGTGWETVQHPLPMLRPSSFHWFVRKPSDGNLECDRHGQC
jgi:hypothetical protein